MTGYRGRPPSSGTSVGRTSGSKGSAGPHRGCCSPGAPPAEGIGRAPGPSFRMASEAASRGALYGGNVGLARSLVRVRSHVRLLYRRRLPISTPGVMNTGAPREPLVRMFHVKPGEQVPAGPCSRTRDLTIGSISWSGRRPHLRVDASPVFGTSSDGDWSGGRSAACRPYESPRGVPSMPASSTEASWKRMSYPDNVSIIAPFGLICHSSIVRVKSPCDERLAAGRVVIAISEVGAGGYRIRGGGRSSLGRGICCRGTTWGGRGKAAELCRAARHGWRAPWPDRSERSPTTVGPPHS